MSSRMAAMWWRCACRRAVAVFLSGCVVLAGTPAVEAAATRFSVLNYRPATDRGEFQVLRQSRNLFQLQWFAGTQSVFSYRLLEESQTPRKLLDRLFLQHLYGGVGLTDWLSVGADLPVVLNAHVQDPAPAVAPGFQNHVAFGDPRLEFKASIVNRYRSPVGFAVVPYVTFPLGKEADFLGDETVSGGGTLVVDAEVWRKLVLSLNVGTELRRPVSFRNVQISTASITYGIGAAMRVAPAFDLSAEMTGRTPARHLFRERAESPAELLVGGHVRVGKTGLALSAGGGVGLVHGAGAPLARGFVGINYMPQTETFTQKQEALERMKYVTLRGESLIRWNIVELKGVCPADPTRFDPAVHDPGCPKYYELRDMAALVVQCPGRPEDFDPQRHDAGCAKVYTLRETLSRADYATVYLLGVSTLEGKCPQDPARYRPQLHDVACQKYFELREVVATLVPRADTDDDGLRDADDRCPTVPGVVTAHGCPEAHAMITGDVLQARVPVQFAFNSTRLSVDARRVLDEVAALLQQHAEIRRVRIEGYADSVGSPRVNQSISQARAQAVRDYLRTQGIAPSRLRPVGFGATHPVAPNTTPEGRALNRRAIFLVIEKNQ